MWAHILLQFEALVGWDARVGVVGLMKRSIINTVIKVSYKSKEKYSPLLPPTQAFPSKLISISFDETNTGIKLQYFYSLCNLMGKRKFDLKWVLCFTDCCSFPPNL